MDVLSLIIALVLIFYLMRGSRPLSARNSASSRTYLRLYLRCIINSWLLLSIVGIIILHDAIPLSSIGLLLPTRWWPTLLALIGVCILFSLVLLMDLRISTDEQFAAEVAEKSPRLALPRTSSERLLWVGVSISVGIWEEIVFRGFLPWYLLHHVTPFGILIPFVWAATFSLILFSLGHLYQGWRGALGAGLVGITLALLYTLTGNLLASILWHILFDARYSFVAPAVEYPAQPADQMKDLPEAPLQPSSPLALRETPQRTPRQQQQRRHKRDQIGQPIQRVPYYARRFPPYPHIRVIRIGRRQ